MERPTSTQAQDEKGSSLLVPAAFRDLFEREYSYVWRSLRRLGVAERDCDDIANEVFVRVHQKFDALDPTRSPKPWLFAFCARMASDYRRLARHRHEVALESDSRVGVVSSTPESDALRREGSRLVLAALESLDDDRRQVFVLHEIDQVPIPEVARALEIPLGTAYNRLRLARESFTEAARRLRAGDAQ